MDDSDDQVVEGSFHYDDGLDDDTMDDSLSTPIDYSQAHVRESAWYQMPNNTEMSSRNWLMVATGVFLVTYVSTALSNYALFQIEIGIQMTLTSISPVYALPVGSLVQGQKVTFRAFVGSVIAVLGIAVLCIYSDPEDLRDRRL